MLAGHLGKILALAHDKATNPLGLGLGFLLASGDVGISPIGSLIGNENVGSLYFLGSGLFFLLPRLDEIASVEADFLVDFVGNDILPTG